MLKCLRDFLLRSQVAYTKMNRYIAKSKLVGKSEAKQRLMPMKDDTHTCLIHETKSSVDRSPPPLITIVYYLILIEQNSCPVARTHVSASLHEALSSPSHRDAQKGGFIPQLPLILFRPL
jgi:hypothetical protein